MKKKTFEVSEPTVLYQARVHTGISPIVPFNGTQAEWNEHFQKIESGEFKSLDVANEEFREWKKTLLANKL